MNIRFDYCQGGPVVAYESVNDNTLKIAGTDYYFDPGMVEYDNIPSPIPGVIFSAYDIRRDEAGILSITLYQGIPENGLVAGEVSA